MSNFGFVYCMSNDAMPGLFKVGYTNRPPQQRAKELSAPSGVPIPFDVLFYLETENPAQVEARLHSELIEYRYSDDREFFKVSDEVIAKAFRMYDGAYYMESNLYQGIIMERRWMEERNGAKGKGMEDMQ